MILADFHTHSSNSGDCDIPMKAQIDAALSQGLKYLCITEHNDFDYPSSPEDKPEDQVDFLLDVDTYYSEYQELMPYANQNGLNLRFGIEIGLQTQSVAANKDLASNCPFDFIIASSHVLDNMDPYYPEFHEGKDDKDTYRRYFLSILDNIKLFDNFDVYGHLDYIIRYGNTKDKYYSYSLYSDEIDAILKKLIDMGKGIEINTGGLRSGIKYPNPCPDVIKRYKELGGEIITVGSDAHKQEHIGYKFDIVPEILVDAGFKYYTIFKERKPEFIAI